MERPPPLRSRDLIAESQMRTLLKVAQSELGGASSRSLSPADKDHDYTMNPESDGCNEIFVFDDESYEDDYQLYQTEDSEEIDVVGGYDESYVAEPGSEGTDSYEDDPMPSGGSSYNLDVDMYPDGNDQPETGYPSWSSKEQADRAYRYLQEQWRKQAKIESGEWDENDEEIDAISEYNEYMMQRMKSKEESMQLVAANEAKERMIREKQKAQIEKEKAVKEKRAWLAELEKQRIKRDEAQRVEQKLDKAEKEEQEAEKELKLKQSRLRQMEQDHSEERITQLEREQEEEQAIARLKADLASRERGLIGMKAARRCQEQELQRQQESVQAAKLKVSAKKAERIKAAVECNEHESSLAIRYSRVCTICQTPNPRRRAVFVACGHMACTTCAEKMLGDNGGITFPCPYCRKSTTFVKLFEDVDDVAQIPEEHEQSRKRKADNNAPSTSRKRFHTIHSRYKREI